jgi:hypothetical protein
MHLDLHSFVFFPPVPERPMKLNPEDLDVMSFETETMAISPILPTNPNDPTPATFCRICPDDTSN